jgi:hypothetical protein
VKAIRAGDREGNNPVEPSGDERRGGSAGEEMGKHKDGQ